MKYAEYDDIDLSRPVAEGKKIAMKVANVTPEDNRWEETDPDTGELGRVLSLELVNEETVTATNGEELEPGRLHAWHTIYTYQRPPYEDPVKGPQPRGDFRKGLKGNLIAVFGPEEASAAWIGKKESSEDWETRMVLEATGREVLADLTVRKDKNDDTKFYQQVGRIHAA